MDPRIKKQSIFDGFFYFPPHEKYLDNFQGLNATETLQLAAERRAAQYEKSNEIGDLSPQGFIDFVNANGGFEQLYTDDFITKHPGFADRVLNALSLRIQLGEIVRDKTNQNFIANDQYFPAIVRAALPFVGANAHRPPEAATVAPPATPPVPPQTFADHVQAKIDADNKRRETQRYLYQVEAILNANNQTLGDLAVQQGLFEKGKLKKSDTAGLSDYQRTILAEINDRITSGRLGPNATAIEQQATTPSLLEVGRDAVQLIAEKTAAAIVAKTVADAAAGLFGAPKSRVTSPGAASGAPAELVVLPDGTVVPKRPGNLIPADSGGTGIPPPGIRPPGFGVPDEFFRRNPADP